jgi:tRNA G18 (ribose-2'-O)-methylase SpoU
VPADCPLPVIVVLDNVRSLNVATAGGVALFELLRRRLEM